MKIYLVGGAVRDNLLKIKHKERDWVVVESTVEEMLGKKFRPVGKEFPVFLHTKTKEEYALARTEKKVGKGYKGFTFYASPDVTLEQDLKRRDLTINAIAQDPDGTIIDPFGGQNDLKKRVLRHVSDAFSEDPVRILRVARFSAKFGDFTIAPETIELMKKMVENGEVDALVPERVWQETNRALTEDYPHCFFLVLKQCGALKVIFPEIDSLFGIPTASSMHPEVCDVGVHTMLVLQAASELSKDPVVRFSALVHDVGKENTKSDLLPKHPAHCDEGVKIIRVLSNRLRIPHAYQDLAILVGQISCEMSRCRSSKFRGNSIIIEGVRSIPAGEKV